MNIIVFYTLMLSIFLTGVQSIGAVPSHSSRSSPKRMMSVSEVTMKGETFNIIVIDSVFHGDIYSHVVPFLRPNLLENSGWIDVPDYYNFVDEVSLKAISWIDQKYHERGLIESNSMKPHYLDYIKNQEKFLSEAFTLVMVTEKNNLDKIIATLRVTRVGAQSKLPLEIQQNIELPRNIIWDHFGIPLQGPPVEFKGLVVDSKYKRHLGIDWFNVLFATVGPMAMLQWVGSPVTQRPELTLPDKIYLECYRKMIPLYEKIGFKFYQNSKINPDIIIMESDFDKFKNLPLFLKNRGTTSQLDQFQFNRKVSQNWMPIRDYQKKTCSSLFGPASFYTVP